MSFLSWFKKKPVVQTTAVPVPRILSYECASVQGIGSRQQQEDAFSLTNATDVTSILHYGLLAIVADGMGGMQGGELASRGAIEVIERDFQTIDRAQALEPQLEMCIHHANQWVYQQLNGTGGSTVVACMIFNQQLYYAGVGDSYLYLLRQGQLIRLNREQNVLHQRYLELIREGCADPTAAAAIPEKQAVTSFLGLDVLEDVDCFKQAMPLQDGDKLLLCSDGIGGMLSQPEIVQCLTAHNAQEVCLMLESKVSEKMHPNQDNYTAVVIRCEK